MFIDCDRCQMRDLACSDCVVNVLLGNEVAEFDDPEQEAIGVLADAGLVPPLRLSVADVADVDREGAGYREEKKIDKTWRRGLPPMRSAG